MRLGIVSDTHMFGRAKQLPKALVAGLQGVDQILHAGDWMDAEVVGLFERIAPIDGIAGNNDGADIVERFGRCKVLQMGNYRIGMVHGDGGRKSTLEQALDVFNGMSVDVIIFGHSHTPYQGMHNGVLLFNPGSPTDKRRQSQYSYGIIQLGKTIEAEIFYYNDKS
ncbi:metallophosphoesterase family protein [Paenibacillus radicis (ex Xue et al. 2023)]|uniref:Phosphoesterase n=1 Tax=Paenibacillus radicis (ex Xue et al. 2023) TaxID=2972489 RepID=A0ABT1YF55_9BACL|nr:metallophosphoesterase family protein [Paenibacillus radicis (ex Xue et al. 2023)]MCR8631826.1 metallophosphatase family protein [Paenibacillus radicis (ex Xue et al. 2023)]